MELQGVLQNNSSRWWTDLTLRNAVCHVLLCAIALGGSVYLAGFLSSINQAQAQVSAGNQPVTANDVALTHATDAISYLQGQFSDFKEETRKTMERYNARQEKQQTLIDQLTGAIQLFQWVLLMIGALGGYAAWLTYRTKEKISNMPVK